MDCESLGEGGIVVRDGLIDSKLVVIDAEKWVAVRSRVWKGCGDHQEKCGGEDEGVISEEGHRTARNHV